MSPLFVSPPSIARSRTRGVVGLLIVLAVGGRGVAELLFDGSRLPEEQGWTVGGSNLIPPYPFFTNGGVYDMNTINAPHYSESSAFHLWQKHVDVGPEGFTLEWRLRVLELTAPHNQYDAPVAFLADYHGWDGSPHDRAQMIYFDGSRIGWADDSASYNVSTSIFHTYRLEVDAAHVARLHVGDQLALTRSNFTSEGMIAFGDQTNDSMFGPLLDGHFELAWIVPEPSTLTGLATLLLWTRRRRR